MSAPIRLQDRPFIERAKLIMGTKINQTMVAITMIASLSIGGIVCSKYVIDSPRFKKIEKTHPGTCLAWMLGTVAIVGAVAYGSINLLINSRCGMNLSSMKWGHLLAVKYF